MLTLTGIQWPGDYAIESAFQSVSVAWEVSLRHHPVTFDLLHARIGDSATRSMRRYVNLLTGKRVLCANQVQHDLSPVRSFTVFEEINALPGSERRFAVHNRYR